MAKSKTIIGYLLPTLPIFLAVALYGYTIRLPFFWDDVPHFLTAETLDGFNQWGRFPTFPYYRPVIFSVWKFFEVLIGHNDPVTLHLLNVFVFGLGGVFINRLVQYISPPNIKNIAGVFAGVGFVLFPFSYRAVPLVGALFHLLLVLGFVLSFYLALLWIDRRIPLWGLAVCYLSAFLAVFSHENGVLLTPLFIGLLSIRYRTDLIQSLKANRYRILQVIIPYILISGIYFILWFWILRPQGNERSLTESFETAMAVMLQGLIYPFATLIRPFVADDINPMTLIGLVIAICGVAFGLTISLSRAKSMPFILGYGIIWYVLSILPAALFLPAGYVLGSPRLTALASVGGCIFWAVVLANMIRSSFRYNWYVRSLGVVLTGLFVVVSVSFLNMQRDNFLAMSAYQHELQNILSRDDIDLENTILINLPDYIIPNEDDRHFLLGTEGVLFVDPSANYLAQLQINAEGDVNLEQLEIASVLALLRNADFGFFPHPPNLDLNRLVNIVADTNHVIITQFTENGFYPFYVGGSASTGFTDDDIIAEFGNNQAYLTNAQMLFNNSDDTIDVITNWVINEPSAIQLFVHVYCDDEFIAQSDSNPLGGTYPFQFWESGEARMDIRRIDLNNNVTEDCLRVFTGLYYQEGVTRLTAINPQDGTVYLDNTVPIQFIID